MKEVKSMRPISKHIGSSKLSPSLSFCRADTGVASARNIDISVIFGQLPSLIWATFGSATNGMNGRTVCSGRTHDLPHFFPVFSLELSVRSFISDVTSMEEVRLRAPPDCPYDRQKSCRKSAGGSGSDLPRKHQPNTAPLPNFHHANRTAAAEKVAG